MTSLTLPRLWPRATPAQYLLELVKKGEPIEVPLPVTRRFHDPTGTAVTVQEHAVDFNDAAACTEIRVRQLLANKEPGCHYLNPRFTVSASGLCGEFCNRVSSCSRAWFRHLDRVVTTRGRKATYRQANKKEKSLGYTGVVVIHGAAPQDAGPLLRDFTKIRRRAQRSPVRNSQSQLPKTAACDSSASPGDN